MKSLENVGNKNFGTKFKVDADKSIASGNVTIKSPQSQTTKDIVTRFKNEAVAVDMEGLGFLKACEAFPNIQYLLIRSISDFLSSKARTNSLGSRELATQNAIKILHQILQTLS